MSQIADIVVYDGTTQRTLVDIAVHRDKGKVSAFWREQVADVPIDGQVNVSLVSERLPSGVYKPELVVSVPVMEVAGASNAAGYVAAPKVAHIPRIVVTGYFHGRSTQTERTAALSLTGNILLGLTANTAVGTSAPAPELFSQLVSPS